MPELVACTPHHGLVDGELHLLGAVDTVTGAMTRVDLGGTTLLIDCGIAQGRDARSWRMPDAARDAKALLLTHGHLDHIGSLPALLEGGFSGPILATQATLEVARISLDDSLRMAGLHDVERERVRDRFLQLARPVAYDALGQHLSEFSGDIAFREAGHIIGSASIELRTNASRVILSGDLGRPNSPILRDPNTEWSGPPVDLVVMEATYGGRSHTHGHDDIEAKLEHVVLGAVQRRGRVLIPAFAIGRTQTLLWFLNHLVENKRIPEVPVVLDTPMGLLVTQTYTNAKKLFDRETLEQLTHGDDPLDFEGLFASRTGRDSAMVRQMNGPVIIIAGSGMCTGGRIVHHLVDAEGLPNPDTTVLFVGHQAEGTPGRRIQTSRGGVVRLDDVTVPVRARLETLNGLSAHADRDELLEWLGQIPHVKRVALHHGDASAQQALVEYAAKRNQPAH